MTLDKMTLCHKTRRTDCVSCHASKEQDPVRNFPGTTLPVKPNPENNTHSEASLDVQSSIERSWCLCRQKLRGHDASPPVDPEAAEPVLSLTPERIIHPRLRLFIFTTSAKKLFCLPVPRQPTFPSWVRCGWPFLFDLPQCCIVYFRALSFLCQKQ